MCVSGPVRPFARMCLLHCCCAWRCIARWSPVARPGVISREWLLLEECARVVGCCKLTVTLVPHLPNCPSPLPSAPPHLPHGTCCDRRASKHTVSSTAATSSRCSRCGILVTYGCIAARLCYRICFRCKREMLPPGEWLYYLPEIDPRDRIYVVFGEWVPGGVCMKHARLRPL